MGMQLIKSECHNIILWKRNVIVVTVFILNVCDVFIENYLTLDAFDVFDSCEKMQVFNIV